MTRATSLRTDASVPGILAWKLDDHVMTVSLSTFAA